MAAGSVGLRAGEPEEIDSTAVVSRRQDCAIRRPCASVDVRAIRVGRKDSLHRPAVGAGPSRPLHILQMACSSDVLAGQCVKEKNLPRFAVRHEEAAVGGKV